jgi:hypothetical protein
MKNLDNLNPLNVTGVRKFSFLPPHLIPIDIKISKYKSKIDIDEWINDNLSGRYWSGTITKLCDNKLILSNCVSFEEPIELTLFLLSCPHLSND